MEGQFPPDVLSYKRPPIYSERLFALARFLISLSENPPYTAALQSLEHCLDDSVNRRLCIPEAFMVADAILEILLHIPRNLIVYP